MNTEPKPDEQDRIELIPRPSAHLAIRVLIQWILDRGFSFEREPTSVLSRSDIDANRNESES